MQATKTKKNQPESFTNLKKLKKEFEFLQPQIARKMDLCAGSKNVEKTFSENSSVKITLSLHFPRFLA